MNTPRTDAFMAEDGFGRTPNSLEVAGLARQLETELAACKAVVDQALRLLKDTRNVYCVKLCHPTKHTETCNQIAALLAGQPAVKSE